MARASHIERRLHQLNRSAARVIVHVAKTSRYCGRSVIKPYQTRWRIFVIAQLAFMAFENTGLRLLSI
jgi:quinol-cytochrome oxidoreductase complex cytochrome b subunit